MEVVEAEAETKVEAEAAAVATAETNDALRAQSGKRVH